MDFNRRSCRFRENPEKTMKKRRRKITYVVAHVIRKTVQAAGLKNFCERIPMPIREFSKKGELISTLRPEVLRFKKYNFRPRRTNSIAPTVNTKLMYRWGMQGEKGGCGIIISVLVWISCVEGNLVFRLK